MCMVATMMFGGLRRTVANNVQTALSDAGMNPTRVAREAGIPRATLIRCLKGFYPFTVDHLEAIGSLLGREPESFMQPAETEHAA